MTPEDLAGKACRRIYRICLVIFVIALIGTIIIPNRKDLDRMIEQDNIERNE